MAEDRAMSKSNASTEWARIAAAAQAVRAALEEIVGGGGRPVLVPVRADGRRGRPGPGRQG